MRVRIRLIDETSYDLTETEEPANSFGATWEGDAVRVFPRPFVEKWHRLQSELRKMHEIITIRVEGDE